MSFECPQCHQMFNLEYNRDLHIEQVCEMKDLETQEKLFINQLFNDTRFGVMDHIYMWLPVTRRHAGGQY